MLSYYISHHGCILKFITIFKFCFGKMERVVNTSLKGWDFLTVSYCFFLWVDKEEVCLGSDFTFLINTRIGMSIMRLGFKVCHRERLAKRVTISYLSWEHPKGWLMHSPFWLLISTLYFSFLLLLSNLDLGWQKCSTPIVNIQYMLMSDTPNQP
jgi:hypothetical protein